MSRTTVRAALDGSPHKGGANGRGAFADVAAAVVADDELKARVEEIVKPEAPPRTLSWWKGIDNKPDMIVPLALLMVLVDLADARREVKIADVLPHFPRSVISPCMRLLSAHGFAVSNGHSIKIHKTPAEST